MFPLLEKVRSTSSVAANCPPPSDNTVLPGNILIHHSRDTAEKQWAETCVLTLAGVARVFSTRAHILKKLDEYPRAWALLLEIIESNALSQNSEVALNSLKSFQEIVDDMGSSTSGKAASTNSSSTKDSGGSKKSGSVSSVTNINFVSDITESELDLWANAWRIWQNIGTQSMVSEHFLRPSTASKDGNTKPDVKRTVYPSQPYLTALINIFPPLYSRVFTRFGIGDLQRFCGILTRAVSMPLHSDTSPFLLPTFHQQETVLSPLQQSVLNSVGVLQQPVPALAGKNILEHNAQQPMYPTLFGMLLSFVEFACCPPKVNITPEGGAENTAFSNVRGRAGEWVVMNYVPLAESSMHMIQELYAKSHAKGSVVEQSVLENIIKVKNLRASLHANPF